MAFRHELTRTQRHVLRPDPTGAQGFRHPSGGEARQLGAIRAWPLYSVMLTWLPDWLARALCGAEAAPCEVSPIARRDVALLPLPRTRDPRDGQWLELLLSPARSGFAITSLDVARIGDELSVPVEAATASPRDGLRTLMTRHPAGALRRLAHAAEVAAEAHERLAAPEASRWAARARQTAQLLREQATLLGTQLSVVGAASRLERSAS